MRRWLAGQDKAAAHLMDGLRDRLAGEEIVAQVDRTKGNRCESSTYATRWRSVEATRRQDSAGGTMDNASFNGMHQDRHAEGADRRIELITGTVRRRRSTIEEKAAIVAESPCAGVNVADVARRFGVNRGLLQTWRRKAIGEAPIFVPLRVEEPIAAADGARDRANTPRSVAAEADTSPRPATLEIESGVVRARFSGPVDATTLRLVMMHIGRHA